MVTNGPEEIKQLPDEAFASHAKRPNPSVDEHVAFPDASPGHPPAPSALPQTAWAPRSRPGPPQQEQVPPELAHIPPEALTLIRRIAARQRPRHHGRLSPVGLGLAAVVALALIMGSNGTAGPQPAEDVVGQRVWADEGAWEEGGGGLRLVVDRAVDDTTIQPVDQPRYEIPLGPSLVRIEVVSDDPAANIVVTSDAGDAQLDEMALPFGAVVPLQERPDQFAVTARSQYGQAEIQCRVYADDLLVSIASGYGLAECRAEPAR